MGAVSWLKSFDSYSSSFNLKGLKLLAVGGVLIVGVKPRSEILIDSPGFLFKVVLDYLSTVQVNDTGGDSDLELVVS